MSTLPMVSIDTAIKNANLCYQQAYVQEIVTNIIALSMRHSLGITLGVYDSKSIDEEATGWCVSGDDIIIVSNATIPLAQWVALKPLLENLDFELRYERFDPYHKCLMVDIDSGIVVELEEDDDAPR